MAFWERKETVMIDPNRVTEAVMEFMANPTWKQIFTNAPGGAMERLAISFYFSKFHDQFKPEDFQEYRDLRDEYEKSMTAEDLQYLIDNSDKDTAIKHYTELLEKIQGGQEPTGNLRFEKDGEQKQGDGQQGGDGGDNGEAQPTGQEGTQAAPNGEGQPPATEGAGATEQPKEEEKQA